MFWYVYTMWNNDHNKLINTDVTSDSYFFFFLVRTFKICWASLVAQFVKNWPLVWEIWVQSLGQEDPLEKGKATHSSILVWELLWRREEPGRLQSKGSQRIGHNWLINNIKIY